VQVVHVRGNDDAFAFAQGPAPIRSRALTALLQSRTRCRCGVRSSDCTPRISLLTDGPDVDVVPGTDFVETILSDNEARKRAVAAGHLAVTYAWDACYGR
jgi:hypothetical protein